MLLGHDYDAHPCCSLILRPHTPAHFRTYIESERHRPQPTVLYDSSALLLLARILSTPTAEVSSLIISAERTSSFLSFPASCFCLFFFCFFCCCFCFPH